MFTNAKAFSSFSVNDLNNAKDFYTAVLGLKVLENQMGLLELHLSDGNYIIIYPKPNHVSATFTILNFYVANIETAVDELTLKGVSFEQYDGEIKTDEKGILRSSIGPNIAWFKDSAGNILSVIEQEGDLK